MPTRDEVSESRMIDSRRGDRLVVIQKVVKKGDPLILSIGSRRRQWARLGAETDATGKLERRIES